MSPSERYEPGSNRKADKMAELAARIQKEELALRNLIYTEFVMKMLDNRHNIEQLLQLKATSRYASYRGYREDDYILPEELRTLVPGQDTSSTLDFSIKRDKEGTKLTDITISTEDNNPILIYEEDDFPHEIFEHGSRVVKMKTGSMETAFRAFLPPFLPDTITTEQAVQTLSIISPDSDEVLEFKHEGKGFAAHIRYTNVDTYQDTIQMLEITHQVTQAPGVITGTRLRITESLLKRVKTGRQEFFEHILEEIYRNESKEPSIEITIENLLSDGNRTTPIEHPTKEHIEKIKEALEVLKRARP